MPPRPPRPLPPLGPPPPTPRQKVLAEWRGVDLTDEEKARAHPAEPAGDLVTRLLQTMRLEDRRAELEIVKVWNHLLDPNITQHAQPTGLRRGTLFVSVDNNVALSEIVRYRRREILDCLQHSFGKERIQRISFRVG